MQALETRMLTDPIGVVGLGYVGLTEATMIANRGFEVIGLDIDKKRVEAINDGTWPLDPDEPTLPSFLHTSVKEGHLSATTDYDKAVATCSAFIIAVPTPVYGQTHKPNTEYLVAAIEGITSRTNVGKLIIIASTVAPGTMNRLYGMTEQTYHGRIHQFVHAPERLSPGELAYSIENNPRVIGGVTEDATILGMRFYEEVLGAVDLMPMSATAAEIVKTAENAYRDIQIAFAHELLWLCDDHSVRFWSIREAINTCPERDVHYPSAGVGGHCIPKDGHLLWHGHHKRGGSLARVARVANEEQPRYIAEKILQLLTNHISDKLRAFNVLFLGVSFKAETRDMRNSPAFQISDKLGVCSTFHDPYVDEFNGTNNWWEKADDIDAIVFVQAHKIYRRPPWGALRERMRHPIALDATGFINPPPDDWVFWQIGQANG